MIVIQCDRCGKRDTSYRKLAVSERYILGGHGEHISVTSFSDLPAKEYEFCDSCFNQYIGPVLNG